MNKGNSFSAYGCHEHQENGVFVVSMAMVAKEKIPLFISES